MFVEEMLSWNLATATFKSFIRPTMRQSPSLLGRAVSFSTGRVIYTGEIRSQSNLIEGIIRFKSLFAHKRGCSSISQEHVASGRRMETRISLAPTKKHLAQMMLVISNYIKGSPGVENCSPRYCL